MSKSMRVLVMSVLSALLWFAASPLLYAGSEISKPVIEEIRPSLTWPDELEIVFTAESPQPGKRWVVEEAATIAGVWTQSLQPPVQTIEGYVFRVLPANSAEFFRVTDSPDPLAVGLRAHYTFDEQCTNSAEGCVKDRSGLGNHGTLGSATSGTLPQAPLWTATSKFAGGYLFNGIVQPGDIVATIGQGIYLPPGVDVDGDWTISAWAKLNNVTNDTSATIYSQKQSTEDCRNLIIHWEGDWDQTMTVQVRDSTCNELILRNLPSNPMMAGQWYHLVAVGDNKTYSFYINGELQESKLVSNMGSLSCDSHTIGMMYDDFGQYYNHYHNGAVDELRIYSRALSGPEILELYNQSGGSAGGQR